MRLKKKADKGNTAVILDKESYIEEMKDFFFFLQFRQPDKCLNFVINYQNKMKNILKTLHDKESVTDVFIRKFRLFNAILGFYIAKGTQTFH